MMIHVGFVGARCRPLVERLAQAGHPVAWHGQEADPIAGVASLANAVELARALVAPRIAWLDLPTGFATELAIQDVWPEFSPGDVIVDTGGGTSHDGRRRAASLASANIRFVDARIVRDNGGALFLGGDAEAVEILAPYVGALAARWTHCGGAGTGYTSA
jgi:6-phosphogluconate dehydrogenase (decarboxylating)